MRIAFYFLLAVGFLALIPACIEAPEGEKVAAGAAVEPAADDMSANAGEAYMVDPAASSVNWVGSKPAGRKHNGTVNITEGRLNFNGETITAGKFTLDMTSINVQDLEGNMKDKLTAHLNSDDFFSTEAYPKGSFEIVSVEKIDGSDASATHRIKGNLTLKNISKLINIPANIAVQDGKLMATTPPFTINRTEWDVNYKASVLGTVQDELIHDEIGLQINLVATPASAQ